MSVYFSYKNPFRVFNNLVYARSMELSSYALSAKVASSSKSTKTYSQKPRYNWIVSMAAPTAMVSQAPTHRRSIQLSGTILMVNHYIMPMRIQLLSTIPHQVIGYPFGLKNNPWVPLWFLFLLQKQYVAKKQDTTT